MHWCTCFTVKTQDGGDCERSRPQGPKNVHNFLITVRPLSWACWHGTEMLLILKKKHFRPYHFAIYSYMTVQRNVTRFCTRLICGWNLLHSSAQNVCFQGHCLNDLCVACKSFCGDVSSPRVALNQGSAAELGRISLVFRVTPRRGGGVDLQGQIYPGRLRLTR